MKKNPHIIKKAVLEMGGSIKELIPERGYFEISLNGKTITVFRKFSVSKYLAAGREASKYKDVTQLLLEKNGLPIPKALFFYRKSFNPEAASAQLQTLHYPIVIKDCQGSNSKGVFVNIPSAEKALRLIKKELKNFSSVLAQEMVFGKEYRILILGDKVIGALEMIPPRVFGDGKKNIKTLIKEKQLTTERKTPLDGTLKETLKAQGLGLRSVLASNQFAYLRRSSCLAEGGETKDVTALVHKKITAICSKVADVSGKSLVGIDVICEDIAQDPDKQSFYVLELNSKPDIYIHYNPTEGETRDVVKDILKFIFAQK